jgi:hypothetical protein
MFRVTILAAIKVLIFEFTPAGAAKIQGIPWAKSTPSFCLL